MELKKVPGTIDCHTDPSNEPESGRERRTAGKRFQEALIAQSDCPILTVSPLTGILLLKYSTTGVSLWPR
jgi:hypothetical protein